MSKHNSTAALQAAKVRITTLERENASLSEKVQQGVQDRRYLRSKVGQFLSQKFELVDRCTKLENELAQVKQSREKACIIAASLGIALLVTLGTITGGILA